MNDKTEAIEFKANIIEKVTSPLGLFALIVLVAEVGLAVTVGIVRENEDAVLLLLAGMITLLFTMIIVVGVRIDKFKVLGQTERGPLLPTSLLSQTSAEGFIRGGVTDRLDDAWQVSWKQYDKDRNPKPYTIKNPQTGKEEPYPDDIAHVKVNKSVITAEVTDKTTGRIYYLGGRISRGDTVTLIYWSKPGTEEAVLVGVVYLQLKKAFKKTTMDGFWIGYDRDTNAPIEGTVTWTKLTND